MRAHVLVECDVVERGVLQAQGLLLQSGVGGLLSALRAVEGAGVCRIAVDGGVGDRELAYDAATLCVEHVLVAAGYLDDAVVERELTDEILGAVGVEELTGQALHGDVGDADVADAVELLFVEEGFIRRIAHLDERAFKCGSIDGSRRCRITDQRNRTVRDDGISHRIFTIGLEHDDITVGLGIVGNELCHKCRQLGAAWGGNFDRRSSGVDAESYSSQAHNCQ